jgi:WD40 repeat protein
MTAAIPSAPRGSASCVVRAFGAHPFRTDGDVLALAFESKGGLWSVEEPGVVRHWDVAAQQQRQWHDLEEPATLWAIHAGAGLAAGGSDELQVWDMDTGDLKAGWPVPAWIDSLAFSPRGNLLATGHDDGVVRLWDPAADRMVREFRAHGQAISALAFSPDGKRLATAGEDKTIHLWDLEAAKPIGSLLGHTDRIPTLAWHPDGKRLLSCGWDTTARVWDVNRASRSSSSMPTPARCRPLPCRPTARNWRVVTRGRTSSSGTWAGIAFCTSSAARRRR